MSKEILEGYRLSPQQKHLWLLGQSGRSAICAVRIDGEINVGVLRQAIEQVVERVEILRTTFKLLPGMTLPVQVIRDDRDIEFNTHDFSQLDAGDQDAKIRTLFISAAERKTDYEGPPLRADLIIRSSTRHVLILSLPAVSIDATSQEFLVSELAA